MFLEILEPSKYPKIAAKNSGVLWVGYFEDSKMFNNKKDFLNFYYGFPL